MWELFCHHTYKLPGLAVDLSDYDNNGRPEGLNDNDFGSDGIQVGSGLVRFPRSGSRIRVPRSEAWTPLVGLGVEVIARRTSAASANQTLVAGHNSFRLKIIGQFLFAFFEGDPTGVNSFDDAIDLQPHPVPVGSWVNLRFWHDGISTMQLFINGQLVAQRTGLQAVIPPVSDRGVSIGNDAERDDRFFVYGEIDEVKIWRLDPHEVGRKFLRRPMNEATVECWDALFKRIHEAIDRNQDCSQALRRELLLLVNQFRRAIAAQGPVAMQRYAEFCDQYFHLWEAGQLDSPEMRDLLRLWCAALQEWGITFDSVSAIQTLLAECLGGKFGESSLLDCDPEVAAFMQLIADTCG